MPRTSIQALYLWLFLDAFKFEQSIFWYADIWLGWKCSPVMNNLAYYNKEKYYIGQKFYIFGPW